MIFLTAQQWFFYNKVLIKKAISFVMREEVSTSSFFLNKIIITIRNNNYEKKKIDTCILHIKYAISLRQSFSAVNE